MTPVLHLRGHTVHARHGAVTHRFGYGVDYLLTAPEADQPKPRLLARNRAGLVSVHDADHGGPPGKGRGAAWLRDLLTREGVHIPGLTIRLLAQPRVLGHVFNPVSFWLCHDGSDQLRAVVAEVTNTFGDRHSYLCAHPDLAPITPQDRLTARKIFHVSPFQPVSGEYRFRFDIGADKIGILIDYRDGADGGVHATLTGRLAPLTNRGILAACLRRPFGSRRVLALIHWQALRLFLKRAPYRTRPEPPAQEVSR